MSTAPVNMIVDNAPASALVDLEPARVWILAEAMQRQHSLMTTWGGPGIYAGLRADEGDTVTLRFRVPPAVTEANITLITSGVGSVTITSSNDATGTTLTWSTGGDAVSTVSKVSTVGVLPAALGAASGRAVTVAATYNVSTSWVWTTEMLTFVVASAGTGTIHGVLVRPVHVAR